MTKTLARFCMALVALVVTGASSLAYADDANYVVSLANDTDQPITVQIDPWSGANNSKCISLQSPANFSTSINVDAHKSAYIAFWRSGSCHAQNGTLGLRAAGQSLPHPDIAYDDYQQFSFDADGVIGKAGHNSDYQNTLETFGRVMEPTVAAVVHFQSDSRMGTARAVQGGCMSRDDVANTLNWLLAVHSMTLGSTTTEKLTVLLGSLPRNSTTISEVTDPNTRVYRAIGLPNEESNLMAGALASKAGYRVRRYPSTTDFWLVNGPDYTANPSAELLLGLQLLATQSTDAPAGQTVSVALSPALASTFGSYVYAFRTRPNSPALGLRSCTVGSGEDQFQVLGNTRIHDLYRKIGTGQWEKYRTDNHTWFKTTAPAQ